VTWETINKKVTKAYISRMCRETPSGRITTKFGAYGGLTNINNRSKFRVDGHRGLNSTGGRKSHVTIGKASHANTALHGRHYRACK
jgi:hypothetical protein